jgi:oligoribonuclease
MSHIEPADDTANGLMFPNREHLVWVDCETTGLDFEKDRILEIAVIITDKYLNEVESYEAIVRQSEEDLERMSEWARKTHSGPTSLGLSLIEACRSEKHSIPIAAVQESLCKLLDRYRGRHRLQVAGSSVYVDKMFVMKWMPMVNDRLHYRVIDVSTFLECVKRWEPGMVKYQPQNTVEHRAISDIRSSLQLMRYYKAELFAFAGDRCAACQQKPILRREYGGPWSRSDSVGTPTRGSKDRRGNSYPHHDITKGRRYPPQEALLPNKKPKSTVLNSAPNARQKSALADACVA